MKRWFIIGAFLCGFGARASADSVQPIVPTGQVTYGSAQKLITSNSDVTIDTTTHVLRVGTGLKFGDGTVINSTTGISAITAWGAIIGTIGNQTDLIAKFTAIGVSTASLQTQITANGTTLGALATSTTTLQSQITTLGVSTAALGVSMAALNTSVAALGVSTVSLQSQVNTHSATLGLVATSTTSLQSQINNLGTAYISTTAILAYLTTTTAANIYLTSTTAASTYLTSSSATATYLQSATAVATYAPLNVFANTTSTGILTATDWNTFNGKGSSNLNMIVAGTGLTGGGTGPTATLAIATTVIAGSFGSTTVIPVITFNAEGQITSVSSATVTQGSSASSLAVFNGVSLISSPTVSVAADGTSLIAYAIGSSSAGFKINPSSGTLQGNTFNGANQLVQMTAGAQYPALNGNLITNLNTANFTGLLSTTVIPSGSPYYVQNTNSLQSGASFYADQGTINKHFLLPNQISPFGDGAIYSDSITGELKDAANVLFEDGTHAIQMVNRGLYLNSWSVGNTAIEINGSGNQDLFLHSSNPSSNALQYIDNNGNIFFNSYNFYHFGTYGIGPSVTYDSSTGQVFISTSLNVPQLNIAGPAIYFASSSIILSGNMNDFNFGNYSVYRSSASTPINITGFAGGTDGRQFEFVNVGTTTITLQNQNASSLAANRIITVAGSDDGVAAAGSRRLWYDAITARWRIVQ